MSDELKLCPHCGNGSLLVIARRAAIYTPPDAKVFEGRVLCEECGGAMLLSHSTRPETPDDIGESEMREILRDRWNTRAAVTDEQFAAAVHDGRVWRAERTCRMNLVLLYDEMGIEGIECDECGWSDIHPWDEPLPERCPGCKAKVVG